MAKDPLLWDWPVYREMGKVLTVNTVCTCFAKKNRPGLGKATPADWDGWHVFATLGLKYPDVVIYNRLLFNSSRRAYCSSTATSP